MLAAECVCAILSAEHTVLRQTLSHLSSLASGGEWRSSESARERLRELMRFTQEFERSHRDKEVEHLMPPLRRKLRRGDELVQAHELARLSAHDRLAEAFTLLMAVERGDAGRADQLERLLNDHCTAMRKLIDREEASLFGLARELLGVDDWSRIASAVSTVTYPEGAEYQLQDPATAEPGTVTEASPTWYRVRRPARRGPPPDTEGERRVA